MRCSLTGTMLYSPAHDTLTTPQHCVLSLSHGNIMSNLRLLSALACHLLNVLSTKPPQASQQNLPKPRLGRLSHLAGQVDARGHHTCGVMLQAAGMHVKALEE